MNKDREKYSNQNPHLSQHQLIRYNEGKMNDTEMHQVEMHLLSCDLCSDALEGISFLEPEEIAFSVEELKGRLSDKIRNNNKAGVPYLRWAAVVAIVLLSSVSIFLILDKTNNSESKIVKKESSKEENLPFIASKPLEELETDATAPEKITTIENTLAVNQNKKESSSNSYSYNLSEESASEVYDSEEEEEEEIADINLEEAPMEEGKLESIELEPFEERESFASKSMGIPSDRRLKLANQKFISGKILDESGAPVPGADIILKGSTKGVISDINGEYKLGIPDSDTAIQISFIGYATAEIPIQDTTTSLTTILEPDMMALSEVVVVGYGTQEKRNVTGATVAIETPSPPKPVDGNRKFNKYLKENLSTEEAIKEGVRGKIKLSFFVEADATLTNFKIIDAIGYGLDEAAIQLVKEGSEWIPAKSGEQTVRQQVIVTIPVNLRKKN